jgi:hypothetical protein
MGRKPGVYFLDPTEGQYDCFGSISFSIGLSSRAGSYEKCRFNLVFAIDTNTWSFTNKAQFLYGIARSPGCLDLKFGETVWELQRRLDNDGRTALLNSIRESERNLERQEWRYNPIYVKEVDATPHVHGYTF